MLIPNAHTHRHHKDLSDLEIFVFDPASAQLFPSGVKHFVSGIHPWSTGLVGRDELEISWCDPRCLGLGEVGLDRLKGRPWNDQIQLLENQLTWAEEKKIKSVVLHCVRAYEDLFKILSKYSFQFILWHDYNGPIDFTKKCMKFTTHSFSFGKSLFRNSEKMASNIEIIPFERLFLESDEWEGELQLLVNRLAEMKKIPSNQIIEKLNENWRKLLC